MRKFLFIGVAVIGLGLVAATPNQAKAGWLSQSLRYRYDPGYYNSYYGPGYGYYYGPSYSPYYGQGYSSYYYSPDFGYAPSYYSTPNYYAPGYYYGGTYYVPARPRWYRRW